MCIRDRDGLDQFINVASGSRLGHTTIAMWDKTDGELYVTESQAGWYWPRAGIQRNKWEDWIQWIKNADMNVVLIPMKEDRRKNFDVDKAQKATCPPYVPVGYVHHFKIEFETKTHRCTAFYVVDGLVVKVHGITAIPRFHLKSN